MEFGNGVLHGILVTHIILTVLEGHVMLMKEEVDRMGKRKRKTRGEINSPTFRQQPMQQPTAKGPERGYLHNLGIHVLAPLGRGDVPPHLVLIYLQGGGRAVLSGDDEVLPISDSMFSDKGVIFARRIV